MKRRRTLAILGLLAPVLAEPIAPAALNPPSLDFGALGSVGLAGNFDALTELEYAGQASMLQPPNASADSAVWQFPNDAFVSDALADGVVAHSCALGELTLLVGGFSHVLNTSVPSGIAGVYFGNQTVVDLGAQVAASPGLANATVNASSVGALWCNGSQAYVGGSFRLGASTGVAVYDAARQQWQRPAFGGFAQGAEIAAIVPHGANVVFGGRFGGLAPNASANASANATNTTVKPGMQPVRFNLANASGFAAQGASAENASSLLCPLDAASGWTAGLDSASGYVNVTLAYTSEPTWIRLFNLADGSGTRTFRIVSQPAGSFMNLTYVDSNGVEQSCAAGCPLPESATGVEHRDFQFVNVVPTTSLAIELLDFFGSHAGLKGIELFEQGQFVFANNALNEPRDCANQTGYSGSSTDLVAAAGGNAWASVADFMAVNITDKADFAQTHAQFNPGLADYNTEDSSYEVRLYTPGCQEFGTCAQRGMVNVSVYPGFGAPQSRLVYQTNEALKYDVVYNGTLRDGAWVRLTPLEQDVPLEFVAYKASLTYTGKPQTFNASTLFEFSPQTFDSTDLGALQDSSINRLGQELGAAQVDALLVQNSTLVVGGRFPANVSNSSLFTYDLGANASAVASVGLNETVTRLAELNGSVFVLTDHDVYRFNDADANGDADAEAKAPTLEATHLGPMANVTAFSLNGTDYWAFSSSNNSAVTLYDPASRAFAAPPLFGRLTARFSGANYTVYAGSAMLVGQVDRGLATLRGARLDATNATGNVSTAAAASAGNGPGLNGSSLNGGINGGVYLGDSELVLFGNGSAVLTNGSAMPTALDGTSDLAPAMYATGLAKNGTLALAGAFAGTAGGHAVQNVLLYNATGGVSLLARQPPPITGDNTNTVAALAFEPNSTDLLVGGKFASTNCTAVCFYDTAQAAWRGLPGLGLDAASEVAELVFATASQLVLAGDLRAHGQAAQVATYDLRNRSFSAFPPLAGPATQLVVLSNASTASGHPAVAVAGGADMASQFVRYFDGSAWRDIANNPLRPGTTVASLAVAALRGGSAAGDGVFSGRNALVVSGDLRLDNLNASLLVYDGNAWSPLYVATNTPLNGTAASSVNTTTAAADDDLSHLRARSLGGAVGMGISAIFAQHGGNLKGGVASSPPTPTSSTSPSSTGTSTGTAQPTASPTGSRHHRHYMPVGHVVGIACGIGIGCVLLIAVICLSIKWLVHRLGAGRTYQRLAQDAPRGDRGVKIM